jgi:hypothetical protein
MNPQKLPVPSVDHVEALARIAEGCDHEPDQAWRGAYYGCCHACIARDALGGEFVTVKEDEDETDPTDWDSERGDEVEVTKTTS